MKFDKNYNKHYNYNYKILYLSPKIVIQYIMAMTKMTRLQLFNTVDKNKVLNLQQKSVLNMPRLNYVDYDYSNFEQLFIANKRNILKVPVLVVYKDKPKIINDYNNFI